MQNCASDLFLDALASLHHKCTDVSNTESEVFSPLSEKLLYVASRTCLADKKALSTPKVLK